jgi:hypothetical protein
MASNHQSVEARVQKLDDIEHNVSIALKAVSSALDEMSKDKPSDKAADREASKFLQTLDKIENEMTSQINHLIYVAAGGSSEIYGATNYADMIEYNELAQMASQVSSRLSLVGEICDNVNREKVEISEMNKEDKFKVDEAVVKNTGNVDLTME